MIEGGIGMRKRIENKYLNVAVSIGIGIVAYELTAAALNHCCGTGLPYLPTQVTPSNALPAAAIVATDIAIATI